MTNIFRSLLLVTALSFGCIAGAGFSADLSVEEFEEEPSASLETAQHFLQRHAVLLMIRATFNILAYDDVEPTLIVEVQQIARSGPTARQAEALDRSLLTEGSYYLVSLEYVVRAGGAAWPSDRLASNYDNDSLVLLEALKDRLLVSIDERSDPLPIFVEAQRIMALTNGQTSVPPAEDQFGRRDLIVERALDYAPWTLT
jgi:hypothetical protein